MTLQPAEMGKTIDGVATLLSPDALSQLDSEIRAAEISLAFSKRTVDRYRGANILGKHQLDMAKRQAETDETQLALLELRLRNTWGGSAPFLDADRRHDVIKELAAGKTTLVRLDFPRIVDEMPQSVRVTPLAGGTAQTVPTLWPAPSGSLAMPGTSFFGIMPAGPGLRPGDRAKVSAVRATPQSGVVIPSAAIVVSEGTSWCYVETEPGTFERKPVLLSNPVADGYLTSDFAAGTKVVVEGASALLSREAEPGSFDDDDDGGDDDDDDRQSRAREPDTDKAQEHSGMSDPDRPLARSQVH